MSTFDYLRGPVLKDADAETTTTPTLAPGTYRATAEVVNPHPHKGRRDWALRPYLAGAGDLFKVEEDGAIRPIAQWSGLRRTKYSSEYGMRDASYYTRENAKTIARYQALAEKLEPAPVEAVDAYALGVKRSAEESDLYWALNALSDAVRPLEAIQTRGSVLGITTDDLAAVIAILDGVKNRIEELKQGKGRTS